MLLNDEKRKLKCILFLLFVERKKNFICLLIIPVNTFIMINSQQLFSTNMVIYFLLCIILLPKYIQSTMTTIISFEYYSPSSNYSNKTVGSRTNGIISTAGIQTTVPSGPAFTLTDMYGNSDGCLQPINNSTYTNGIAIIKRGGNCTFSTKITRGQQYGAIGIIFQRNPNSQ
jgi:hypothetical protein